MEAKTATVNGLQGGKEQYVDMYVGKWTEAELDELESIFDTAIAKLGSTDGGSNEQEAD
jgi:hypothetical protein